MRPQIVRRARDAAPVLSDEARFLTMTTGPFEDMVRSLSRPAASPGLPPQEAPTTQQVAALVAACRAHGIEFLEPADA